MRSKEPYEIGGSGIDTQYERDYINYRPRPTHQKEASYQGGNYEPDDASHELDVYTELKRSTAGEVWNDIVTVIEKITELETTLAGKLTDITVPIPASSKSRVQRAAEKIGHTGIVDTIPFSLYRKTFAVAKLPEASLIQDTFEEYVSDVDGTLNAELYADVAEIQQDWVDMAAFSKKALFAQFSSPDDIPNSFLERSDGYIEEVKEKEKRQMSEYLELLRLQSINREILTRLGEQEMGSDAYYSAEREYDEAKRHIVLLEKKLFTKAEVVDLVSRKASDTEDSLLLIENSIDYDPYAEHKYEVLYALLQQFPSKREMQLGLRKMQAVLKLSVDRKRDDQRAIKNTLRGLAGGQVKRRMNNTLVSGIHLRNGVFSDVYDMLRHLDGVPSLKNFDLMANHVGEGIEAAEHMYRAQVSDFYKIHALDDEMRRDKLTRVLDKDMTRSTYQLMRAVLDYAQEVDVAWPTAGKLSGWLNDFMEQAKIK